MRNDEYWDIVYNMAYVAKVLSGEADMTKKLLQLGDNYHWQLEGIEFAIPERVSAPKDFIGRVEEMVGFDDRVVQMLDEFQNLNLYIDAGVEDKPCKAYLSTAESRLAPLIITGSLMGVVIEELTRWLPMRFGTNIVPKMKAEEAHAMTLN